MDADRQAAIHASYERSEDIGQQVGEQMEARVNRRRRRSADEHSPSQNAISRPAEMVKVAEETGRQSLFLFGTGGGCTYSYYCFPQEQGRRAAEAALSLIV